MDADAVRWRDGGDLCADLVVSARLLPPHDAGDAPRAGVRRAVPADGCALSHGDVLRGPHDAQARRAGVRARDGAVPAGAAAPAARRAERDRCPPRAAGARVDAARSGARVLARSVSRVESDEPLAAARDVGRRALRARPRAQEPVRAEPARVHLQRRGADLERHRGLQVGSVRRGQALRRGGPQPAARRARALRRVGHHAGRGGRSRRAGLSRAAVRLVGQSVLGRHRPAGRRRRGITHRRPAGRRLRLEPASRVRVGPRGLADQQGAVRSAHALPRFVLGDAAGRRSLVSGAFRQRSRPRLRARLSVVRRSSSTPHGWPRRRRSSRASSCSF